MIIVHRPLDGAPGALDRRVLGDADAIPADALWIDLVRPPPEEDRKTERFLGIEVPTREDQQDIEPSELLYAEHGARYLTTRLLTRADEDEPELTGVSFILKYNALFTVRNAAPRAFSRFAA